MLDGADVDGLDLDSVEVTTEHGLDTKRRLDILVRDPSERPLLVIEYKVDAAEGEDQTRDYAAWAKDHPLELEERRVLPLLVFLCPDREDETEPAEPFVHVPYEPYCQWLLGLSPANERAKFLVAELLACLDQRDDVEAPAISEISERLKSANREAIETLRRAPRKEREGVASVLRRHARVLDLLGVPVGRRALGRSAFVDEAKEALREILTPDKWTVSGTASLIAEFRPSVQVGRDLVKEGTLGRGCRLRLNLFLSRPKRGSARLALAIRGILAVPGHDADQIVAVRHRLAAALRERLRDSALKGSLRTRATVAAFRIKVPGVQTIEDDAPKPAAAARPAVEEAATKVRAVEGELEQWCRDVLPDLLRAGQISQRQE